MCDPFSETHRCVCCCVYKNPSQGGDKINTSSVHICDTLSHIHTCNAVKTMNVSFDIISCIKTVNILCDIISVNTTLKGALHTKTRICGWVQNAVYSFHLTDSNIMHPNFTSFSCASYENSLPQKFIKKFTKKENCKISKNHKQHNF